MLSKIDNQQEWDEIILSIPNPHPLQLWGWGEVKKTNGWSPYRFSSENNKSACQVLVRKLPLLGSLAFIPRGPLGKIDDKFMHNLISELKSIGCIAIQVEPELKSVPNWLSKKSGWHKVETYIFHAETFTIDLNQSEEEILAKMSSKTRQYIRKSGALCNVRSAKDGDIERFYDIFSDTAKRANFNIPSKSYYQQVWQHMSARSNFLVAELDGKVEAFLWNTFASGGTAFEFYGGMSSEGAKARLNYSLKWEAIKLAKSNNCKLYDMNARLNDSIKTFKSNFGPEETDFIGTYQIDLKLRSKLLSIAFKTKKILLKLK